MLIDTQYKNANCAIKNIKCEEGFKQVEFLYAMEIKLKIDLKRESNYITDRKSLVHKGRQRERKKGTKEPTDKLQTN